jgi:hypothetical protein
VKSQYKAGKDDFIEDRCGKKRQERMDDAMLGTNTTTIRSTQSKKSKKISGRILQTAIKSIFTIYQLAPPVKDDG